MTDKYLWDRSGKEDSTIVELERLLSPYGCAQPTRRRGARAWRWLAIAASVVLAVCASLLLTRHPISVWQIGGKPASVGQTIQTGLAHGERLIAPQFGEVELEPNSSLEVLPSVNGKERIALRRGAMHALIWAPASNFLVDTPSARTVDLGCSYTLSVLPDNSGLVSVQAGWVAFQNGRTESFIPAGAACRTSPQSGPGIPYFEDAPGALLAGISRFGESGWRDQLPAMLASARPRDGLSLWHLVRRTSGVDRALVIQRFAELVPALDRAGLQAGQDQAIDGAWNRLDLGGTELWRMWKQTWRAETAAASPARFR